MGTIVPPTRRLDAPRGRLYAPSPASAPGEDGDACVDRGRRRHPGGRGFRRVAAPPHARDRRLPHAGARRQVHRHRHQGLRQDAAPQGQAHPLPARGPGGLPAARQPARQADRRQDLRPRVHRALRRVAAAVVEGLAVGDRDGGAEALRRARRPQGRRPARRPDRRHAAAQRHRPLRPPARLHAERAAALRDRDRRPPGAAPARAQRAAGDLHRRHRRVLQQARRGPAGEPERDRRAVAQRLVLRAARAGRGGLSAAPHQPPPEGVRGDPQGGVFALAAAHGDGPAVPRQRRRHRVLAGEPARDLRQQRPPGQERPHGPGRARCAPARSRPSSAAPA